MASWRASSSQSYRICRYPGTPARDILNAFQSLIWGKLPKEGAHATNAEHSFPQFVDGRLHIRRERAARDDE
jgi:hypothetical protein